MDELISTVQTYTPNDVFKTAFKYIDSHQNGFGAGLTHGINQVCVCCKAGSLHDDVSVAGLIDRITDAVDVKPWADFYKTKDYAAYKCRSCGYQWSWYKDKQ